MNEKTLPTAHSVLIIELTPVGSIMVSASDEGITGLCFCDIQDFTEMLAKGDAQGNGKAAEYLGLAAEQLTEYFRLYRKKFTLPLDLSGETYFTRKVLEAAAEIPYGTVISYGELADRIGKPGSARAVGGALGRNPVGIIIPCHRVVSRDGKLHGYSARGGIRKKAELLQLEGLRIAAENVL